MPGNRDHTGKAENGHTGINTHSAYIKSESSDSRLRKVFIMQVKKANQAQFLFRCGDLEAGTFMVTDFTGRDNISSPYDFTINCISKSADIQAADVINKQATLYIFRDGEYCPYSGIVSEFRFVDATIDIANYRIRLVPRLWLASLNEQTRVFQKMTVNDIVKKVLDDAGLASYYTIDLTGTYPEREYVVQYQESDLNFISRIMENAGIWFFFREAPMIQEEIDGIGVETMVISDSPESFQDISGEPEIIFRSASGLNELIDAEETESISKMSVFQRVAPKEVFIKNFNYRTPEVDLSGNSQVTNGDAGTIYRYGGNFKNTDEARMAAEVLAGQLASDRITAAGSGKCRSFRAGARFTLKEHMRSDCNDTFLIRDVVHSGTHRPGKGGAGNFTYINDFNATPSAFIDSFRPVPRAVVPRIPGVITAKIETNGSDYASIDDMGRYKVRMPFDISDSANTEASKYVRLSQPYSGSNYGMHFPSHEGAEMVLACINGDPDKPIGVGTVPNADTVSPVVSSNQHESVIRTAGGNEMVFDDSDGKQKFHITTKGKNTAEFDDENKCMYLQTTDQNKLMLDDTNECVSLNAADHNITMSYKSGSEGIVITSKEGHIINIDDKGKMITVQTKAGHIIQMNDDKKVILLSDCNGKNTLSLDGEKGMVLETKGKLSISATQDIEIKGANIKMSASTGKIDIKATQDLGLEGMKINEKATTDYKLEALNISSKAKMKFAVEANLGVDIKSSLQTKIAGTMTELSGQAMTTVKGGVVMIN